MTSVVFASYYISTQDPQRFKFWDNDPTSLLPLINSVVNHGIPIKIFHDCFDNPPAIEFCDWVYCTPITNYVPTIVRWFNYFKYLTTCEKPDKIFMVDSTDVVMLNNPFNSIVADTLYCGTEFNNTVSSEYLKNKEDFFNIADYKDIINLHTEHILLNCGICGGYTDIIVDFLSTLTMYHSSHSYNITQVSLDMPIFNYTILKHFKDIVNIGDHINTKFKEYEIDNTTAWWKHK